MVGQTGEQTDRRAERQESWQTGGQTDRRADRRESRQRGEQTERRADRQVPLWLFRRMVLVVVWYRLGDSARWGGGEGHLSAESSSGWNCEREVLIRDADTHWTWGTSFLVGGQVRDVNQSAVTCQTCNCVTTGWSMHQCLHLNNRFGTFYNFSPFHKFFSYIWYFKKIAYSFKYWLFLWNYFLFLFFNVRTFWLTRVHLHDVVLRNHTESWKIWMKSKHVLKFGGVEENMVADVLNSDFAEAWTNNTPSPPSSFPFP